MPNKKYLIVVGGPTASGKTSFAIQLAQYFQTEILSADSRQFYQEMTIGTAKPEPEELQAAPHHFINHLSINEPYSVGQFETDALALLETLYQKHDFVILVGGSGLYIKALCEGLDQFPEVPLPIREALENQYKTEGIGFLQQELQKVDPAYAQSVDINNPHRLIRALAVYRASGRPFSEFRRQQTNTRPFHPIYLQLQWSRDMLYQRIETRVDQMIQAGLVEEVRQLIPYHSHSAMQTVGYQEIFPYLKGESTLEEAIDLIKRNSRRYAKRQLTWNRRDGFWKHLLPDDFEVALQYIEWVQKENFYIKTTTQEPENTKWLEAQANGQVLFKLKTTVIQKAVCFSHFTQIPDHIDHTSIRLFAHETALYAEDQDAYLLIPPAIEPFFLRYGFQHITLAEVSSKIRNRWSDLENAAKQSLLIKSI